jgi:integrase
MPRVLGKLTGRRVATAKPRGKRRATVFSDGGNLWLQVSLGESGNVRKSWTFRYAINGKQRVMGLGSVNTFSLAEARERARALRQQLADGHDPLELREAARQAKLAEAAKTMTFEQCTRMYLDLHADGWSAEHSRQWNSSVRLYVLPQIGDVPVRDIDQAAVMKIIEPLWQTKRVTASRVRARVEAILDYATAHRFREGDNPARILSALPTKAKPVQHLAALPWREMPAFMSELRALQSVPARCAEFLILTAARSGEAIGATWDEIDLKAKTWTVPAARMKARAEHRVPLSASAVELLSSLTRTGPLVFGGTKVLQETALRRMVLAKLRPGAKARRSTITTHGMRAAFKTWASDSTNYARDIVEVALAHKRGGKVEQSYERGDLFEKRRRLMEAWSKFCAEGAPAASVVPMRGARHA